MRLVIKMINIDGDKDDDNELFYFKYLTELYYFHFAIRT